MAADKDERTEDPTEKKKTDARNKGQVARSKELATMMVLLGAGLAFLFFGHYLATAMAQVFKRGFTLEKEDAFDPSRMFVQMDKLLLEIGAPMFGIIVLLVVFAFVGNIAIGGFNFSTKAMAPKFSKMNPLTGIKRILGIQGLIELVKSVAKVLVVVGAAYMCFKLYYVKMMRINIETMPMALYDALDILLWIFIILSISLLIIAVIDIPFQIYQHNEQLKMTKQEVKDEHKNAEGDPQVKGRIRNLMFAAHKRRMLAEVPKADVVVTNPTHYAVAIKYDQNGTGAPRLIAKGADELAKYIREIAEAHEIPILTAPLLARSIYYTTEVEAEVPAKLFAAVAQVLAYVYALKDYKKGKSKKRPKAFAPSKLPIPPDMRY